MDHNAPSNGSSSIHLQVSDLETQSDSNFFAPQSSIQKKESSNVDSVYVSRPEVDAPEKKLTLFALRLAVLEKAATGLGTLGFIWATVVLLGGFAITLEKTDFWFITVILLIEGARIFSRSHELEWQHQATWTIADAGINSFRALKTTTHFLVKSAKKIVSPVSGQTRHGREVASCVNEKARNKVWDKKRLPSRTWTNLDVPLLPYAPWVFLSRNVSRILYWLQLLSATACVVLSLMRLIRHNFGEVAKGDSDKRNRKSALVIFYSLALAEALLFLLEKTYWEWKVSYCKLLERVNRECGLGAIGMVSIRRFFYDAYSKCINGSIFDGLKMDMVSFAMELLASSSADEQLIGASILQQFATNEEFSDETLQKIGINISVIEKLVEILNWKDPEEEEIRRAAAGILSRLAGKKQNSLRVVGIPGAMESISSLLYTNRCLSGTSYEISQKSIVGDQDHYEYWTFNLLGLHLLKKLARDHENCAKIGNTRGLLPKIIEFTHAEERLLKEADVALSRILIVKRSLQVVNMLASTAGSTGKYLRKEISEIVFTISNIRDILRHGERHPKMQKLGIKVLTSLALDVEATEKIGSTGGLLKELLNIFLKDGLPESEKINVRISAGEALAMLALESKENCHRILNLRVLEKLLKALEDPLLSIHAARILCNLCTYIGDESINQLSGMTEAESIVLSAVFSEETKLHEAMVGLAVHVFRFMKSQESIMMFKRSGIKEAEFANALVQILKKHPYPPIKIPRIRRFAIELVIWMMKDKDTNIQVFKELGLEEVLQGVLETTDEIENFNIFSGTVGVFRHKKTVHSLAETALKLLAD